MDNYKSAITVPGLGIFLYFHRSIYFCLYCRTYLSLKRYRRIVPFPGQEYLESVI